MSTKPNINISHKDVINKTICSIRYFFIITGCSAFLYGSRTAVWIEYAKTFSYFSNNTTSWILSVDSLLIGFAGIFFASLGDYIGFDKSITFKLLLITIGCILETFATSFSLLCIGFLISQTATVYVSLAYISWILPIKYAKKQISSLYSYASGFYLAGPLFSGILYQLFNNYRVIFIINSILMMILVLIVSIFVFNKQNKLEELQIAVSLQTNKSHKEALRPILLSDHSNDDNDQSDSSDIDAYNSDELIFPSFVEHSANKNNIIDNKDSNNFCHDITIYEWYLIINILIEYSVCWNLEASIVTYYLPYTILHAENTQYMVLISTLQITAMSIVLVITFRFSYLLEILYKYISANSLIICISLLLFLQNLIFLFLPRGENNMRIHLFWVYLIITGISIAFLTLIFEYLLLEIQPAKHSGKINGIKALIQNIIRSIFLLFIGLYWDITEESFIYAQIIAIGTMLFLQLFMSLMIILCNKCCK